MKSIKKVGLVEKVLNYFGYYKPVEKKAYKPRAPRASKQPKAPERDASTVIPLT